MTGQAQQPISSRSFYFGLGYLDQCACFVGLGFLNVYLLPHVYKKHQENKIEIEELEAKVKRLQWDFDHGRYSSQYDYNDESSPLKPILFPCRTSHTRFFPQKHNFSYSYLYVGIPVGWRGWVSSFLTADLRTLPWRGRKPKNGWFNVDSADFLARGDSMHGLRGKLDTYLESQNEKVEDYPIAYLVTAPRFLGYSFNPVSFWYLYNRTKKLKAMILEVNNTFDERRMYFLKDTEPDNGASVDENENLAAGKVDQKGSQGQSTPDQKVLGRFAKSWPKDFHVSPFNSRKGAYSLSANDPFFPNLSSRAGAALVNNTITLSSSKQHPKLIARVFSSSDSIDPYKLKGWSIFKFIAAWWWVGLVTFPRIAREAGKLFFRRKLHVWYRPEVLKDSIGRNETQDETAIATIFRHYLKTLVESSELPFALRFLSGIATMSAEESFKPHALCDKPNMQQSPVNFKITSPLFYAQISRCTSVSEYIKIALSKPDPGAATFHTSHPDLLTKLFEEPPTVFNLFNMRPWWKAASADKYAVLLDVFSLAPTSLLNLLRWVPIYLFRRLPSPSHHYALSDLDACAVHLPGTDAPKVLAYRKAVLKMLLSDYVAFGMPAVIDAALWIVKIWLCWLCVQSFDNLVGLCDGHRQLTVNEVGKVVLGCLGVHLWWGLGEVL
ncbi:hypothetical protein HO133_005861 [Letharia lupina]|uniref:Uncharacterized protein n=1 Tax=Letharia lupina TaxID=560253 RepID=A0A8H6F7V5_9LECA|nr:uncharacterized protein HO133_005861 [Letharia lupina]KAF6218512.1 hypothetical protein HO133_005861 [Letharia lupina]